MHLMFFKCLVVQFGILNESTDNKDFQYWVDFVKRNNLENYVYEVLGHVYVWSDWKFSMTV